MGTKNIDKSTNKPKLYKAAYYCCILIFLASAVWWLYEHNRYHILAFFEEQQLFRTDYLYFQDYIAIPAGLIDYASSFITQFYHYPILGAVLLSLDIIAIYMLFIKGCRNANTYRFFIVPYIIPLFLLISCTDIIHFGLTHIVGLIVPLLLFLTYTYVQGKKRYAAGVIFYLLSYFISGGNAIIFGALLITYELFHDKRSYLYIGLAILLSIITPYLAYRFIYITHLHTAYLCFTPFDLLVSNKYYTTAWLAVPVLYFIWRIFAPKRSGKKYTNPIIVLSVYTIILVAAIGITIKTHTDEEAELVAHMAYEVEKGNWDTVLELGKDAVVKNQLPITYFTDIALSEKGSLLSDMFKYPQTGTYGLFLPPKTHYETSLYMGELYFRLGLIQETEHCAYEALVLSRIEHGSKALRRLVYTSMVEGNEKDFCRYIGLFDKSPVYKNWAKEQRGHFNKRMKDPSYRIPEAPNNVIIDDIMINYWYPTITLEKILESNRNNKKAFEYLMASYLLSKDLKNSRRILDIYLPYINYKQMPRHIKESILLDAIMDPAYNADKYNIDEYTIKRFNNFNNLYSKSRENKLLENDLKKEYGNTYFYYFLKSQPTSLEDILMQSNR